MKNKMINFLNYLEEAKEWNFHDIGLLEDIIRKFKKEFLGDNLGKKDGF